MNDKRFYSLLLKLNKLQDFVSSKELAALENVSSRTIRDLVKRYRLVLETAGAHIETVTGKGMRLQIDDEVQFQTYLTYLKQSLESGDSFRERINYMLYALLLIDGYHKLSEFSDALYVAAPVVTASLKKVRNILQEYHLQLINRPHYGMYVKGDEFQKRLCAIASIDKVLDRIHRYDSSFLTYISQLFSETGYSISDYAFQQFYAYLQVSLYRIRHQHILNTVIELSDDLSKEKKMIDALTYYVQQHEHLLLTDQEKKQMMLFLYANRIFALEEIALQRTSDLQQQIESMLSSVNELMGIDLSMDMELKTNLQLHLYAFDIRVRCNMRIKNPLLEEIKAKYALAFECASIAVRSLESYYQQKVCEDEVAYIAILMNLGILRLDRLTKRKNILLVCCSGRGTSRLLLYEMQTRFSKYIKEIKAVTYFELNNLNLKAWNLILTTIDLPQDLELPVVRIHNFLDAYDVQSILAALGSKDQQNFDLSQYIKKELFFTNISFKQKREAIDWLVEKINEQHPLPENFKEYIWKREENGKTEYAELFALPHPYVPITDTSFISIAILDKPMVWDEQRIRIIFMISTSKYYEPYTERLYEALSKLLIHKEYTFQIIHDRDYDAFLKLMKELQNKE